MPQRQNFLQVAYRKEIDDFQGFTPTPTSQVPTFLIYLLLHFVNFLDNI